HGAGEVHGPILARRVSQATPGPPWPAAVRGPFRSAKRGRRAPILTLIAVVSTEISRREMPGYRPKAGRLDARHAAELCERNEDLWPRCLKLSLRTGSVSHHSGTTVRFQQHHETCDSWT